MRYFSACVSAVGACAVLAAGELLPNGIRLPDVWPPMCVTETNHLPMHVPYLEVQNIPDPIPVDGGRQLFVDDFLIAGMSGLERIWGKPEKFAGNPVMTPETALEKNAGGNPACALKGGGVWWDAGRKVYRMWYESGWLNAITYAESADGIAWTRPNLNVVPGGGNRLIAAEDYRPDSWSVIRDPDAPPAERWKMFVRRPCREYTPAEKNWPSARKWTSADGIRWNDAGTCGYIGDRSTLFYNPFRRVWVFSQRSAWRKCQTWHYRTRSYCERRNFTDDTAKWDYHECEPSTRDCPFWLADDCLDAPDPEIKNTPQVYDFDAVAYETLFVGVVEMLKGPGNLICEGVGKPKITDLEFCFSRDGFHFSRTDRKPALASERWSSGKWDAGYVQPCSSVCIVTPEKLRFYYSAFAGDTARTNTVPGTTFEHPWWRDNGMYANGAIGFAEMRRDGFAGLKADTVPGCLVTRPLTFSGQRLYANVNARAGNCRVDVMTPDAARVLASFALRNQDSTKAFLGRVGTFAKQTVRLRFTLDRATLYSFWISPYETGESGGYLAAGGPGYPSHRDLPIAR